MSALIRALTRFRTVLIFALAASVSLAGFGLAQQKGKDARTFDKIQQQEIQALTRAVDDVAAGQPVPADFPAGWQSHFIKASDQKTFIPFRITVEQSALPTASVSLYLRAVRRGPETPAAGSAAGSKTPAGDYAFEDVHFLDLRAEAQQPYAITRALSVPAGDYDVYAALKERPRSEKRNKDAAPPKMTVIKQTLSVPDLWNGEMATSSIFIAEKVEPITQPLSETELAARPYAFLRSIEIVPAANLRFSKKSNLSIIFQVYNASLDEARKPNVTVDYSFHHKVDGAEKFFNRTEPQVFSAATLQPEFDGHIHQIPGGQEIPLASFPEGEYRLEIKVADKIASKALTRQVTFVVTP